MHLSLQESRVRSYFNIELQRAYISDPASRADALELFLSGVRGENSFLSKEPRALAKLCQVSAALQGYAGGQGNVHALPMICCLPAHCPQKVPVYMFTLTDVHSVPQLSSTLAHPPAVPPVHHYPDLRLRGQRPDRRPAAGCGAVRAPAPGGQVHDPRRVHHPTVRAGDLRM